METKIKSPKRYDELRSDNPTVLLQGNMFTPESAGPRELSMLCFKVVNMGYADAGILLRYVQCSINILPKMRIKHIALVLQSVSKYVAKNAAVLTRAGDTSFEQEIENREKLLMKVLELIELLTKDMFKLFARAVPKDLGMVSLSMVTICEHSIKELDITKHSYILNATESTLRHVAEIIGPKLPFCELQEYAALAKAFCKMPPQVEYADLFLRDLANEISCLLNEKNDYMKDLLNGTYVGDDILEELPSMPRELTTIACTMSRRVKHHSMWRRMSESIELMIKLGNRESELFSTLDGQTLVLLATSLSRHADVSFLLETLLENTAEPLKPEWSIICIGLALNSLDDMDMAKRMWDTLDFSKLSNLNDTSKAHLLLAAMRIPSITEEQMSVLRSFGNNECSPELLVSLYACRHKLGAEWSNEVVKSIMESLNKLNPANLVTLLKNADEKHGLKAPVLSALYDKIGDLHIDKLHHLILYIIEHHAEHTELIEKLLSRISEVFPTGDTNSMLLLLKRLEEAKIDPTRFFSKASIDAVRHNNKDDTASHDCHPDNLDSEGLGEEGVISGVGLKLSEQDDTEIAKLSRALRAH